MKIKNFFKEHPVIFMGLYTIVYFVWFLYLEKNIKPKYIISCPIDDLIPFCEVFIVPYLLWFVFIPAVLFSLMYSDRESFWKMAAMMFTGNIICLILYGIFPNGVVAKKPVANENIFCYLVNLLYYTDTPTNVCPSIHVLDTLSAHIAICRSRIALKYPWVKSLTFTFTVLICIATVTLKQHSIIDVFCSFCLMLALEKFAYSNVFSKNEKRIYIR